MKTLQEPFEYGTKGDRPIKRHVVFAAPFFMDATLRFIQGTLQLPNVDVSVISQESTDKLPEAIRAQLAGHWRVGNGLDAQQIVDGVRKLEQNIGKVSRLIGMLEQLQVPLAQAREALGLPGLSVEASLNFRDKARMKEVMRAAKVPCARHALVGTVQHAIDFTNEVGYPLVVKPPAGAGGKNTFRLESPGELMRHLHQFPPQKSNPWLYEEFVRGSEYSFDSVIVDGAPVWHSISQYFPTPLEVMENTWIQWCVMLPRQIDGPEFDAIRSAAFDGVRALGLETGLTHMEWFALQEGRIAISEVGARPPGAQFTSLLSYAHDHDFYRAWPHLMVFDEFPVLERRYAVGAAYLRGQGAGRVRHIAGLEEAQRRFGELVVEAKLPSTGQAPSDSYEGDGYVIVRHPETGVVENALQQIVELVRIELG